MTQDVILNKILLKIKSVDRGYKTECWEFQRTRGYAHIMVATKTISVHRYMFWQQYKKNEIDWINFDRKKTVCVCHKCDNSKCCNPEHLFAGSQQDNVQDAINKNRQVIPIVRGEVHGLHKLTEEEVLEIYKMPGTSRDIATQFGVSHTAIVHIKTGETWAWLTGG